MNPPPPPSAPPDGPHPHRARGSATARTLRAGWREVRDGWRASPGAGPALLARLAAGTAVVAALSGGSAWWLSRRATDGRLPLDGALEPGLRALLTVHQANWLAGLTGSAVLVPLVALVVLWAAVRGRWIRSLTFGLLYLACKVVTTTGWLVWERARPRDVLEGALVPPGLSSYPSGHTLQGVALWGLLVWWWTRTGDSAAETVAAWLLYAAVMAAVGVARVEVGAHHPTDVLGAGVLGLALLGVAAWAERSARR